MNYDEFRSVLRGKDFSPLYFFTGEEDFLQTFCLSEAKKALIDPSFEDFNYKCYIEAPSYEDADSFINALPLMSEKKLVIFNCCHLFAQSLAEKAKWEKMFAALPSYVVCIVREKDEGKGKKGSVVEQSIKASAVTVNFDFLPEARLRQWLVKAAASQGKTLNDRDSSYIIASLGQSMTLLKTEIGKICAKAEDTVITRNDIDAVISNRLEESVFNLIDAVFASRCDLAYSTLAKLEAANAEPVNIIALLASQALSIYKAKLMMTQRISIGEVKKAISKNPYAADKMIQKASKISMEKLEELINVLTEEEYKIKNGLADAKNSLYMIVSL